MNNNPSSNEDFDSAISAIDQVFVEIAESSIVNMIVTGSGGPENQEITEPGLRFVRYLIAKKDSFSSGIIPNFKDDNCIRDLAKEFIRQCGTPTNALKIMYQNT